MKEDMKTKDCMIEAIAKIENFVAAATGITPEPEEIAAALSKYFVLKEILAFVELERQKKTAG